MVLTTTMPSLPCLEEESGQLVPLLLGGDEGEKWDWRRVERAYLLAVKASVIGLDDDEAVTSDVETGALNLLDVALVLVCSDNLLHLGGRDL